MIKTSAISTRKFFTNAHNKITLSEGRKNLLLEISETISKEYKSEGLVNLNFICTHNSRRSQIAQVWAFFAAHYFDLNIYSFSGGTEVTSFYRNTIKTLQKASFSFNLEDFSHQNPKYLISFDESSKTILGFSKRYDHVDNKKPFIAITTCNNADTKCPFIAEAIYRFHLPFVDPKPSDGTPLQKETYLNTNQQIAGEIYFIFAEVKKALL
ncbi:low molecular weight phosphatase family protein [Polaribacter butkevichii]|uniref:Arsenate reductase n=1 Tax=Polaribacter butkevichii TaxID=218490 RepID=A0A2P6CFA8_9FLAO|nr:hypothetical protein [Polaribacter butkevichii]PQJ73568.1 hypothetical protein BTO14_09950 [Polaribacter butkevichii]